MNEGWAKPTGAAVPSSAGVNYERSIVLTVILDSANQYCGETENHEGNEETLGGVPDKPQKLPGVEKELNQKGEGI